MEIRKERVNHPELVAGIDEEAGRAFEKRLVKALTQARLQRPCRGGADRDYPAAFLFRGVYGIKCLLRDAVALLHHPVLFDPVCAHRHECPRPRVQRHMADEHAHCPYLIQNTIGKMEPCRRRCHSPNGSGKYGLISYFVSLVSLPPYIRRERDLSCLFQVKGPGKPDRTKPVFVPSCDLAFKAFEQYPAARLVRRL